MAARLMACAARTDIFTPAFAAFALAFAACFAAFALVFAVFFAALADARLAFFAALEPFFMPLEAVFAPCFVPSVKRGLFGGGSCFGSSTFSFIFRGRFLHFWIFRTVVR